jgi:hypothetical protein
VVVGIGLTFFASLVTSKKRMAGFDLWRGPGEWKLSARYGLLRLMTAGGTLPGEFGQAGLIVGEAGNFHTNEGDYMPINVRRR